MAAAAKTATPDGGEAKAADILLGFSSLSVTHEKTGSLLFDVSGYVVRGGVTAVLGASSSGKSILLKALAGRIGDMPGMRLDGFVTLDGSEVDCMRTDHSVAYMPQPNDSLIGVLTARQLMHYSAALKTKLKGQELHDHVERLLAELGLAQHGDTIIGTLYKAGLSGGQKRRVVLGGELVGHPSMLFLDEPTSGLDTTTALSVIKCVRETVQSSNGQMGAMVTIHQPNIDILRQFDHLLLLSGGQTVFFGTLQQALEYFRQLGFPTPAHETPTDYFLQLTDATFPASQRAKTVNFASKFHVSVLATETRRAVREACHKQDVDVLRSESRPRIIQSSWLTQYVTLLRRNTRVAVSDLSLYWMQFVLHAFYGFLVGAMFWRTPTMIDYRLNQLFAAIAWFLGLNCYMHTFKAHYFTATHNLFSLERPNHSYSPSSYFAAELTSTLIWMWVYIPGFTIAYYMVDLPNSTYGFYFLTCYVTIFTAEGMAHMIMQFAAPNTPLGVMLIQGALVIGFVFTSGVFLPISSVPDYWNWLRVFSVFAHSGDALMVSFYKNLDFTCPTSSIVGNMCVASGQGAFPCDVVSTPSECIVSGLEVLRVYKGFTSTDEWKHLLYCFILGLGFRFFVLVFYRWPVDRVYRKLLGWITSDTTSRVAALEIESRRAQTEIEMLREDMATNQPGVKAATRIQRAWRGFVARKHATASIAWSTMHRRASRSGSWLDLTNTLVFRDVSVIVGKNKVLLDNVSGFATAGRVVALMGPSGAGKTTLLNALSGRATYARILGDVVYRNAQGVQQFGKHLLDFVPQFDTVTGCFTVAELLMHTTRLKTAATVTEAQENAIKLLNVVGLQKYAGTMCSKLTGGLLKRVSIALGLVSNPRVLFLDEPTTGLDSTAAYQIVKYITNVARVQQIAVVMTIHQPSAAVFNMLDDVLLLAPGGKTAYFGPVSDASAFFMQSGLACKTGANPADCFLNAVTDTSKNWQQLYRESPLNVPVPQLRTDLAQTIPPRPSEPVRGVRLIRHFLKQYWRDASMFTYRNIALTFFGFFIGTMFLLPSHKTSSLLLISGALFFSVWVVLFIAVSSCSAMVTERLSMRQGFMNDHYTVWTWSVSQFIASLPYTLLGAILFSLLFHWLLSVPVTFETFVFTVVATWQLQLYMDGIDWIVVEICRDAMLSVTFTMIVLGSLFLFAGFFVFTSDMPPSIRWISYMLPSKYSFRGLLINFFHDVDFDDPSGTVTGDMILDNAFRQDPTDNKWAQMGIQIGYIALFRVAHAVFVWFTLRNVGRAASSQAPGGTVTPPPARGPMPPDHHITVDPAPVVSMLQAETAPQPAPAKVVLTSV